MKAAIVTIYDNNYGNKLQNYALQELLKQMGHEADTILVPCSQHLHFTEFRKTQLHKFNPAYMKQVVSSRFKNRYPYKNQRDGILQSIKLSKTDAPSRLKQDREKAFMKFSQRWLRTVDCQRDSDLDKIANEYDAFVCGSDQVWNPNSTSPSFFLQFAPEQKRIAFAPSFGVSRLPEDLKPVYKKWLSGIPNLSVREEKGAAIIREITGRDASVIPDPTLCVGRKRWEALEKKPSYMDKGEYVLTYFLGNETKRYRQFVERQAEGRKIIDLYDMRAPDYYATDPAEFVWLVHHARAMFTDSFHGTVFSLIFHTPFVVFDRIESGGTTMSSRIETLLKVTGTENRHFQTEIPDESIDFHHADIAIKEQVAAAESFLQNALLAITEKTPESMPLEYVQEQKKDCSGCAACINVCPVDCISMELDEEGFRYPRIDLQKCIHCNKCRNLCLCSTVEQQANLEQAYVARSKNESVRSSSSSGGVFTELASAVLDFGGTVYGAGFDDRFQVLHKAVTKITELEQLKGSKYVQSNVNTCYPEIRTKLENGEYIYFSGTPCQVNALLAFLNKDYEKLYTQDIICHGVPSPKVWKAYLQMKSGEDRIEKISFRNKRYGWHYFSMLIKTEQKEYCRRMDEDVYTRLFLDNVILRPSCYSCKHKHLHRKADFTIGDCWSLQKLGVSIPDDDKGLSLLFINTEKGARLLNVLQDRLKMTCVSFDRASNSQGALTASAPYNPNREVFFALAEESSMEDIFRSWFGMDLLVSFIKKYSYMRFLVSKYIHGHF